VIYYYPQSVKHCKKSYQGLTCVFLITVRCHFLNISARLDSGGPIRRSSCYPCCNKSRVGLFNWAGFWLVAVMVFLA
jgi:hypothetical protein